MKVLSTGAAAADLAAYIHDMKLLKARNAKLEEMRTQSSETLAKNIQSLKLIDHIFNS